MKAWRGIARETWAAWAVVVLSLVWMYHGALAEHMRFGRYPLVFNDDSRQYVWLFLMDKQEKRPDDILYDYRRAAMPLGYKLLYSAGARLGDPRLLSKGLPYFLLLLLLATTAYTASALGGTASAWAAMGFILSSGLFLERMTGGHPRAFAFPLAAGLAAALVAGRPRVMALLTVLGAAFYPVLSVIGGLTLAAWMCLDAKDRGAGSAWPVRRRLGFLAVTGIFCLVLVLPNILAMRSFGPPMRPSDVTAYPEYGPDGRYQTESDRPPFTGLWKSSALYARATLEGTGELWSLTARRWGDRQSLRLRTGLLLLCLAGISLLARRREEVRRLLLLPAVLLPLHPLAQALAPTLYLPQRYVVYLVPVLVVILVPVALSALPLFFPGSEKKPRLPAVCVVLICGCQFLLLGGRGAPQAGYHIQVQQEEWVYPFLATLPSDAVIAGWPGPFAVIDNMPYVSARTAFLTFENHEVYYRGYADEMRRRMRALIDAYYATDVGPLLRLRDEFHVTYLLVEPGGVYKSAQTYFKPYNVWSREAYEQGVASGKGFEVARQVPAAGVFGDGRVSVLDLRRLKI